MSKHILIKFKEQNTNCNYVIINTHIYNLRLYNYIYLLFTKYNNKIDEKRSIQYTDRKLYLGHNLSKYTLQNVLLKRNFISLQYVTLTDFISFPVQKRSVFDPISIDFDLFFCTPIQTVSI
jgi:hypothetical protein